MVYLKNRVMMMIIILAEWLTDKKRLAIFPARPIARDPHRRKISDTPPAGSESVQNLSSGLVE